MVKFLKINGADHPVRISYYALKMLKEKTGKALSKIADDDFESYETLLFYSLKKGAQATGGEFTFKETDMEDVMDEVFMDFMALIPLFFAPPQPTEMTGGNKQKK